MHIQLMLGETLVTPRVRFFEPLNLMKEIYGVSYEVLEDRERVPIRNDDMRFLIRARMWHLDPNVGVNMPKVLFEKGYLLLHELDDHPENWLGYTAIKGLDFLGSHYVTTSTEAMRDALLEYTPNVKVFENQIARLLPPRDFKPKDEVRVFFGALNRGDSWADIMPVINEFAEEYGEKLQFTVISDINFFKQLNTKHKEFIGSGQLAPLDAYMKAMEKCDIALLPLLDKKINRCKSDLKFIECANAGLVSIASPVVYEKTVKDGETGLIYKNPQEFREKFGAMLKFPEKRVKIAKNAYEYVKRERLLSQHINERYDWMNEIYQKREELHRDLLKRLDTFIDKYAVK